MDKKNILTQLAIISDLVEKTDFNKNNVKVFFDVDNKTFQTLIQQLSKISNKKIADNNDTFTINIDGVVFVFNRNNV